MLFGMIGGLAAVYLLGVPLRSIGDGGTTLAAIVCGALWLLSASMGSTLYWSSTASFVRCSRTLRVE